MFDLSGRRALVTGAGGMGAGTGAGIARALAEAGAEVMVNDRDEKGAIRTAEEIEAAGGRARAVIFDVTDHARVTRAAANIGPIDILVNNAGGAMGLTQFKDSDPASWTPILALNLIGVLNCSHAFINGMCERGWGRVITMSSGAGLRGLDIGVSIYAAAKGGSIGFMRHLASETGRFGVTANTIALGLMGPGEDDIPQEQHNVGLRMTMSPLGRLGKASDAGALCVYLASEEAKWMTGQVIPLNGGGI